MREALNAAALHIDELWWWIEPFVEGVLRDIGIAACMFVIGSVCCRFDAMRAKMTSLTWPLIYGAWGAFAMGTLLDQLRGHAVDWYDTFGACAIVLYLLKTRHQWRHGAPRETDSRWGLLRRDE